MSEQRDELAAAFLRTEALANKKIDRRNWTTDQWADDAERIMGHIDGASSALLNGHITALVRTIRGLREATKPRTIATVEELDALPMGSKVVSAGYEWTKNYATTNTPSGGIEREVWFNVYDDFDASDDIYLPATVLHEPTP